MKSSSIKEYFVSLSSDAQNSLLQELQVLKEVPDYNLLKHHVYQLNNKQGSCAHCESIHYKKDGKDKGIQKYKCKKCNRSFTAYTGTWMAHIHKKHLLIPYLKLMNQGFSLDKIKASLKINKKTAFDWRHKINSSLTNIDNKPFKGITESDETFFYNQKKDQKV